MTTRRRRLTCLALIGAAWIGLPAVARADEPPWWTSPREIEARLFDGKTDIGELALEMEKTPLPTDAPGLRLRLLVCVRAGHFDDLDPLFRALGALPEKAQREDVTPDVNFIRTNAGWDVARRMLELVPHARCHYGDVLLDQWHAARPADDIEAWLRARMAADASWWWGLLCSWVKAHGDIAAFRSALEADIRTHPADVEAADRYLCAASERNGHLDPKSIEWLGDACQPRLAIDCARLAESFPRDAPRGRIPLLRRAITLPFTKEDREQFEHRVSIAATGKRDPDPLLEMFTLGVKRDLMDAYRSAGQATQAQALLEELTAASPGGLPDSFASTAGLVQRQSGARVVEEKIRAAEAERKDSARYWLTRAQYFVGRKEANDARDAFEKALALSPRAPARRPDGEPDRYQVVEAYGLWLWNEQGVRLPVFTMVRAEFDAAEPASFDAQELAVRLLSFGRQVFPDAVAFAREMAPERERFWALLAAQDYWPDDYGRSVVGTLVAAGGPNHFSEPDWDRAVGLAAGHARRDQTLANLARTDPRRAVPVLKDALRATTAESDRGYLRSQLVHNLATLNDWATAELVLRDAPPSEQSSLLAPVALAAARAGAKADAIRLWARHSSFNRGDLDSLDAIVSSGLRDELIAFYEAMATKDPRCAPARLALARLEAIRTPTSSTPSAR
jgi:tetratricopeptide (TPR) repeat protein